MSNTIQIRSKGNEYREEALCITAVITPGMLVERTSADKFKPHATAGGLAKPLFAIEDDLQGNSITDDYAVGDLVQAVLCQRGDIVNALLADGETVVIGDALESAGTGKLRKHVAQVDSSAGSANIVLNKVVGFAREAVDMSGSSGADPSGRILVEVA